MRTLTRSGISLFALCAASLAGPVPALAVDRGRNRRMDDPVLVGGGSDVWARFNAPQLSEDLPGKPTVVVINDPGGGSTKGKPLPRARPDGLTILAPRARPSSPMLATRGCATITPTGTDHRVADRRRRLRHPGVRRRRPRRARRALNGIRCATPARARPQLDLVPLLGFKLMGLDVQHVFGFKGRGDGRLAFERGEVNIDYQTSSAYIQSVVQPLVDAGQAVPLFSWGALDADGDLVRDPTFPDLPHFGEAYEAATGRRRGPNTMPTSPSSPPVFRRRRWWSCRRYAGRHRRRLRAGGDGHDGRLPLSRRQGARHLRAGVGRCAETLYEGAPISPRSARVHDRVARRGLRRPTPNSGRAGWMAAPAHQFGRTRQWLIPFRARRAADLSAYG